jgi:hypothetical protein
MIEKNKGFISSAKTDENKHLKNCDKKLGVSSNKRFAQNSSAVWARLLHGEYDFQTQQERKAAMAFADSLVLHFGRKRKPIVFPVVDGDLCSHHKIGRNDVYFPLGQWNETLPIMLKVLDLIRRLNRE